MQLPRVLWVDDEPAILAAMARQLRHEFHITPAGGGLEGLDVLRKDSGFAVIVADLKMPVMDGIEFLAQARKLAPDATRLMLTGFAALESAMLAVNEGQVFRFLTKPAEASVVRRFLNEAVRQHQLVRSERELLEETLRGSLQVLMDVLALASPNAFNRAARIRDTVESLLAHLQVGNAWALLTAAGFVHLGYVTLPAELLNKLHHGVRLEPQEEVMFKEQRDLPVRLLAKIPRMDPVTAILRASPCAGDSLPVREREEPAWSAHVLHTVMAFDRLLSHGVDPVAAVEELKREEQAFSPAVLTALEKIPFAGVRARLELVAADAVEIGMLIGENIYTADGVLLVPKGYVVNEAVRRRLINFAREKAISAKVPVLANA
jgi:CheY-like chemotaxis protein